MKTMMLTGIIGLLVAVSSSLSYSANFWYSDSGQTPLLIDSTRCAIRFESVFGPDELQNFAESVDRIDRMLVDQPVIDDFVVFSLTTGTGYAGFLDSIGEISGVQFVEPYYVSATGAPMLVSENICIAFEEYANQSTIDSLVLEYSIYIIDSFPGMSKVLIMRNSPTSGMKVVELANELHELSIVRYAHPDFVAVISLDAHTIYDFYSSNQWQSQRIVGDFNAASVWDFAGLSDSGIIVAVIDDGVATHEDLPASRLEPDYDFADMDADPSPAAGAYHGMSCAG